MPSKCFNTKKCNAVRKLQNNFEVIYSELTQPLEGSQALACQKSNPNPQKGN
jgi:hypothetical protein